MIAILILQALTFIALGTLFLVSGDWRLGAAQFALCVVQVLIYA